jgi:hypothetical protein
VENKKTLIRFEDLGVVAVKSLIFFDMMPCSPLKVNWLTFNRLHSVIFHKTGFFIKVSLKKTALQGLNLRPPRHKA